MAQHSTFQGLLSFFRLFCSFGNKALAIIFFLGFWMVSGQVQAQLIGIKNIPGDYPTLNDAITDLNTQGVGAGGVTLNLVAGNPQTAPAGGYSITTITGTLANQITIQGNANIITASPALTVGALNDAIFKLIGADYVTITGFTMQENVGNIINTPAASNNMTEWGVALLYASLTDGAQNNTILNNTISLNKNYRNTFGVYSNTRHSAVAVTVSAEVTASSGSNSFNKVHGNNISDVGYGIVFIGAGTTIAAIDNGNDIGGTSALTGNTITNWGGGAALSTYVSLTGSNYCIFDNQQINDNVSFNTITSAALAQGVTTGGFLKNYSIAAPTSMTFTSTINNNTVTVTNNPTAATAGTIIGINSQGLTALAAGATISMNNNTVQNCVLGGATSTTIGITGITNLSWAGIVNMTGNTVLNNSITSTTATTGSVVGISNSGAGGTVSITGNSVIGSLNTSPAATTGLLVGVGNSGAAGTVNLNNNIVRNMSSTAATGQMQGVINSGAVTTAINMNNNQLGNGSGGYFSSSVASAGALFGAVNAAGAATALLTMQNNDIQGITYSGAASSSQNYYNNQIFTGSTNISNNTFTNLSVNTTGSVVFINNNVTHAASTTHTINNNSIVTAFSKTAAGGTIFFYNAFSASPASVTETNSGNNFSNLTFTGATTIAGWRSADGTTPGSRKTVTNNIFNNITGGTGAITSILYVGFSDETFAGNDVSGNVIRNITNGGSITGIFSDGQNQNFFGNTINTLSSTGVAAAVNAIQITGATTQNIFKNKIYDIEASDAAGTVNGILLSGGATFNVYNNLIGDLRTPNANAANPLVGINLTGGTTLNAYFNTINLNATSTGALFGSSAISVSTTPTVTLNNNIFVNTSTAVGGGLTVAHQRSSTTLTTYANISNNNLFYAGTPSATNVIYYDGTTAEQTLAAYQAVVTPRDAASISSNPPFLSTTGSSADFLHIDPSIATLIESGGVAVAGITDDFDGNTRSATPDIGADEGNFTPLIICSGTPVGGTSVSSDNPVCSSANFTLSLTGASSGSGIAYQWQSSPDNITYTDIIGATSATLLTSQATATYYRNVVTCTPSNMSANSTPVQVTMETSSCLCAAYCTPSSAGGACLTNVTFNTLNNTTTGCSPSNYSLETATTSVEAGVAYNLTLTTDAGAITSVWIDYDQNGTFAASEWAQVFTTGTTGTISVLIPITATVGSTRMRIRSRFESNPNGSGDACTAFGSGEAEDYCITITPSTNCTGAPTGGTTASSANPVCSGVNFTLSLTGSTVGGGITYQWQASPDNVTYTDIGGATNPTLMTSQIVATYYRAIVTCTPSSMSANSTPLQVTMNTLLMCYCPTSYPSGCGLDDEITNVALDGSPALANPTGCAVGAYTYFTPTPTTTLTAGNTYNLSVSVGSDANQFIAAWIDYNLDGILDASENIALSPVSAGASGTANFMFTVPGGATPGLTRLRVRGGNDSALLATQACGVSSSNFGETEDYDITIVAGSNCMGTPAPGNTTASSVLVCSGNTTTLGFSNIVAGSGVTYQWQSSPDNITYTDIGPATSSTYVATITASTYYQVVVTCTSSGMTGTSTPLQVVLETNVDNCYCAAGATILTDEKISNVNFSNINNTSSATAGYEDFTSVIGNVQQGQTYTFTGTLSNGFAQDQMIVWIDYNHDGDFVDAGEQVFSSAIGAGPFSTSITISGTATVGNTRMRVRLHDTSSLPNVTPCGDSDFGQVEDYTLTVAVACTPPTVNAPTVTQPTCAVATGTIVVNATGGTLEYSVDNGATYQASATFAGLAAGSYDIKVRLVSDPTCMTAYASNPVVLIGVATTNTWTGTGDGINWNDAANWSNGIVTLPCQNVVIPTGFNVTVPAGFEAKGLTLDVAVGATLTVTLTGLLTITM